MKTYRVYSLDGEGGICGDRVVEADCDDDAIWTVRSMQRALDTEIWDRDRRIARVPAYRG